LGKTKSKTRFGWLKYARLCCEGHNPFLWTKGIVNELMSESSGKKNPLPRRFTLLIVLMFVVVLPLVFILPIAFGQSTQTTTSQTASGSDSGLGLLAAGVAIAGSCAGAGYAVGKAASSAAAAIVERPATFGPLLILAGLGEGIAIYGLLVAFQILSKIT
jgi:V/A-type H+/Na+-transporting ATPase subunit K